MKRVTWSWLRHIVLPAILHPVITFAGFREGRGDMGLTFDDDPYSDRSVAYDVGRAIRCIGRPA